MKYRKKSVFIEAMQFTNETKDRCYHFVTCSCYASSDPHGNPELVIETLEGNKTVRMNDWIIKDGDGYFHPVKPNIFEAIYEPVE